MIKKFFTKHFVVLLGNGFTSVIGFAMAYIIFHYLSEAEAGMWFFLQSFVGLCEACRYGFLSTAAVKFYAGTDAQRGATVLGSVWFLAIGLSVVFMALNGLAFFALPFTHNYEFILCIKWVGLNYLSSLPADVVFWRLQADEEYTKMFWFRMINSCSTILSFIVLVLLHRFTLENVIIYNFVTNCTSSLIGIIWYKSGIQYIARRTKECMTEIFHFGKYTFGTTMFSSLLGNTDTWILNFVLGPAAVAVYNLGTKLMAIAELPLRSFATTAMSEMSIAYNAKDIPEVGNLFRKYAGMLTIVFILMVPFVMFGADYAIELLGGHKFDGVDGTEAANIFRLIMIMAIAYPVDRFNGIALDVTHNTRVNFYKMVIVITLKIACGFVFTALLKNVYGIVAANYISLIVSVIYGYYQLRKHVPHTLSGVLGVGYKECILLLQKSYAGFKK